MARVTRRPPSSDGAWRDEFGGDPDGPSEADLERFGGETYPCPECATDVFDDASFCHTCGRVLQRTDAGPRSAAKWWVLGFLLACAAVWVLWGVRQPVF